MQAILSRGGFPYIAEATIKKTSLLLVGGKCRDTVIYIRTVKQNQKLRKLNPSGYKLRIISIVFATL